MRRLSSLGSRHLAHRKGRSVLTAGGIALGVAILFGVLVSNATTQSSVDQLIRDFTGNADVLVRPTGAFDAAIPESISARLARVPDVRVVAGSYNFTGAIETPNLDEPVAVSVRGIVLRTANRLQEYRIREGRMFRAGKADVVIPRRLVEKVGLRLGEIVPLRTPEGLRPARLVGILADLGAGRTNQGDVVFTSIETSRAMASVGRVVSGARLQLAPGTSIDGWIQAHQRDLGPGLDFRNARTLAQGFQDFLNILGAVFAFFAALTLFVGAFLIYLTLTIAVVERVRTYGTMRALGATRRQVRRVVLAEAAALGVVSTIAGLAFGLAVAKGLLALTSQLFEIDMPGLTVRPAAVAAGIVVGIATTLVASLVPAHRAARLSPVVAMRGDYAPEAPLGRAWMVGAACLAFGITLGFGVGTAYGTPLILLGAVLLTPLLLRPLARLLGRLTNRIARGVGDVAVLHLVKERSRSAYTLALIMVVMAMIFSIGGLYATLSREFDRTFDRQFGADIEISSPQTTGPPASIGRSFEAALRRIPGVDRFAAIGFARIRILGHEDDDNFARIIDPDSYFDVTGFVFAQGTERDARRALERGGAVLLPADRAVALQTRAGGTVTIDTTEGSHTLRVAATYQSIGGPPELVISASDARRYLRYTNPSEYQVNVTPGTDVDEVVERIDRALGQRYSVEVMTTGEVKEEAHDQFDRFFNIFYAILMVAAVVGLLGLANTLAVSVLQRYREIGVLRAIGTTRSQVRRMVLVESATLGLVAFALSLPLGLLMSVLAVHGIEDAFAFRVQYVYPASWVPGVIAFGIVGAVLAALAPARRAARLDVVTALQYE